ncbi:CRTAC1 family protein [Stieleria neptunia]|uniref:CRTAC1 family protein n=1 Tax=Stieleria neptunia TaxID=2527979 RepID=UPI0018D24C1D|nr:CRTAC1 family protein [Stieleria neptunia]
MNAPQTNRPNLHRRLTIAFAAVATSITMTFSGCSCTRDPGGNGNGTTPPLNGESEANLVKINQALAATENMEPEQAETLWAGLRKQFSDDPSVALNRALNSVLAVDMLTAAATDSVKSGEEKQAARARLPDAIETARTAIEDYQQNSGDEVTKQWLNSRIDAHEAALLGATIGKSLRRDLFTRLTAAIDGPMGDDPRAVILGGPLIDLLEKMSDPVDGLPDSVLKPAAKSLRRLSDENEDNLFLALRALRLAIDNQDPSAAELVDRTWRLAQAVEPTLAAYTKPIGLSPEDLVNRIKEAIEDGDWGKADQSSVLWSNVLNPLEIVRTDRRRTSPHPLDRLNFNTVRELSSEIASAKPIASDETGIAFDVSAAGDAALVLPVDADLDFTIDLASVSGDGKLNLLKQQGDAWDTIAELDLGVVPSGLVAADLFMVDSSDSDRIKRSEPVAGEDTQRDYSTKARHDTLPTLVAYGPFGLRLIQIDMRRDTPADKRLTLVEKTTGLEDLPAISAVTTGDLEGDGDLDLIVAPSDGQIRVWINRGNRTFFEAPIGTSTVDDGDPIADMTIADLDRDIDLDVLAIHRSGRVSMLENLLHLQFRFRNLDAVPPLPVSENDPALTITVEDVDANVGWDVVATSSQQSTVAFGNSSDIGVWTVDRVETAKGFASPPVLADFDNDSYLELIGPVSSPTTAQTLKLGPWGINVIESDTDLPEDLTGAAAADVNGDGRIDLVSTNADGIQVGVNQPAADAHQISVRFKGIADNAAASGRVNHYAIGSVLELRFGPHYRSRIVRGPATHFGMDGFDSADTIRVIMPNGLTQTIRSPEVDSIIEEEQTLKGSCPYLYSWDGERFAFVTDCLWAAPLGLQVAAGVVQPDRPWEYLKIDGDKVRPNDDGEYEFRLTEELWEVAYVDKIELTAVDHPADVAIYSNEKVGPPSVATPTIYSFDENELHPVTAASDTRANDVTELLTTADERYVQGFDRRIRQGLCPPHWIDLDFGDAVKQQLAASDDASVYLVLRGWILPTDTSLNIQIDQNPELPAIEFPSVWVPDASAESGWKNAIEFMGFPGGKTKTIVVDVSEHVLLDDPRIRVRTSAQIYWDAAALAIQENPASSVTQPMSLIDAEVGFHGFSKRIQTDSTRPETYDYGQADAQPKWPPLRGAVTQFGDCSDRLRDWDDSMVVISGGDEIRMRFRAPEQELPAGWKRDFILHCVGWDKDADLNTLTGQSIGPLPIRDMRGYPPTLESANQFDSVERKNADSLRRRQSFRAFWNRGTQSEKPFLTTGDAG